MNTAFLFLFLLLSFGYQKCGQKKTPAARQEAVVTGLPACVQARIDEIKKQPRWNPPATVEEYNYSGKRVFLFSSPCCDQYNEAVDDSCNYVCAPTGGITGKGDRKCTDFGEKAQLVGLVWRDERKN
jgi:hypothetical protein